MTLAARLGGAALEQAARDRLGPAEADAFLARLEQLSFDITEPLEQVYGAVAGDGGSLTPGWSWTRWTRPPGAPAGAADARPAPGDRPGLVPAARMIGYVCLRRPVRRLRWPGVREPPRLPGRAGRHLPAPDAAAAAARRATTTAATRWPTTTRSTRGSARWPTSRRWPTTCTSAAWRCASTWCSTTPRPSTRGPARPRPATRRTADFYLIYPDRDRAGRVRAHAARGVPRQRPGQLHRGAEAWAGSGRRSTASSGT